MRLDNLQPAINAITNNPDGIDLRGQAYLRTYPYILNSARQLLAAEALFPIISCLAYGWMPRVLRVDGDHFDGAVAAFDQARQATHENWTDVDLESIDSCLRSLVGASKVVHFSNPDVFPMWDSNVERFRLLHLDGDDELNMTSIERYREYCQCVRDISDEPGFDDFVAEMNDAVHARFRYFGIPNYNMGSLRIIDLAIFELANANNH